MVKNIDGVDTELIENKALLRLHIHILNTRYLEKGALCFTEVNENNEKMIENGGKAGMVSNSKKESKRALHKEIKDAWALLLAVACPSASAFAVSMLGFAPLSTSAFAISMPRSSIFLLFILLFTFDMSIPIPKLSVLLLSSFLSAYSMSVPIFILLAFLSSAFLFVSSMSILMCELLAFPSMFGMHVLGMFALPSLFTMFMPVPELFFLQFLI